MNIQLRIIKKPINLCQNIWHELICNAPATHEVLIEGAPMYFCKEHFEQFQRKIANLKA